MADSLRNVLVVGNVPRSYVAALEPVASRCRIEFAPAAAEARLDAYDLVVTDGSFDFFDYLEFAESLAAAFHKTAPGGALRFIRPRRPRLRDDFFCYRTDSFFEEEFLAAGEAAFASSAFAPWGRWLTVSMEGRLPETETASRLTELRHGSLARLPVFAGPLPLPGYIWTAATTRCNLRCHTCSVRSEPTPGKDMAVEVIDRIFGEFADELTAVNVTGIGEALFSRNWPQLHRRIRSRPGRLLEIVTNAMLLKEEQVRDMMLPENPTWLCVSIDGATRETFEAIRDRGKWDRLLAAMEMIRRLRDEIEPPGFRLVISFTAVRDNVRELPELFRLCREWRVDTITVGEMGDWELNKEYFLRQALRFDPKLANEAYAAAREAASGYSFENVLLPPDYTPEIVARGGDPAAYVDAPESQLPLARRALRKMKRTVLQNQAALNAGRRLLSGLDDAMSRPAGFARSLPVALRRQAALARYTELGRFRRVKGYCEVVDSRVYFHANGDVVPCCGMLSARFGNVAERPLEQIWNSPQYRDFRVRNLLGYPDAVCYYCTLPYGLPSKNPENFLAEHRIGHNRGQRLASVLRRIKQALQATRV